MALWWKKVVLDECTRRLPSDAFQRNPYFPDLLNQPDLLVVPELGRLISIHQYDFRDRITWRHVLGAVEDVFELKTAIGPRVAAVAVISRLHDQHDRRVADMISLLSNAFDMVVRAPEPDDGGSDWHRYARILEARPQERLLHLWQSELLFHQRALSKPISDEDYAQLIRPNTRAEASAAVRDRLLHVIESQPARHVRKGQLVESIKPEIGQLGRPYRFHFDYAIDTAQPRPRLLLDVVNGHYRGMRGRLRYLMAKVRLTRYWTTPDGLAIRAADYRHLMVVNGNLAGPGDPIDTSARCSRLVGPSHTKHRQNASNESLKMKTYKQEVRTILFALKGSPWASHGGVQDVIVEYGHLQNADSTPTQSRRISLQIFHAARAIDTMLGHVAQHECVRCGRTPPTYWTLGMALRAIQRFMVRGSKFTKPTETDVHQIKRARNTYLHRANCFPSDQDMHRFINSTVRTIAEAAKFQP